MTHSTTSPRRRVYREYVAGGELPAGYATEDGVGLHYIGTELREAVAMRDGAQAWWVEPSPDGGYDDKPDPATQALTARRGFCVRLPSAAGATRQVHTAGASRQQNPRNPSR